MQSRAALWAVVAAAVTVAGVVAVIAVGPGGGDTSADAVDRLAVSIVRGEAQHRYVLDGDPGAPAARAAVLVEAAPDPATVERLASALGIDGEASGDGVDEPIEVADDLGAVTASPSGGWGYSCCERGPDVPWAGELPDEATARDLVAGALDDAGMAVDDRSWDLQRSGEAWSIRVGLLLDGWPAQGAEVALSIKPGGGFNDGGGSFGQMDAVGEVELLTPRAAVDQLNASSAEGATQVAVTSVTPMYLRSWPAPDDGRPRSFIPAYRLDGTDASGAPHRAVALAVDASRFDPAAADEVIVGSVPVVERAAPLTAGEPEIGTPHAAHLIGHCYWVVVGDTLWDLEDLNGELPETRRATGDGVFTRLDEDSASFHSETGQIVTVRFRRDVEPPFGCA